MNTSTHRKSIRYFILSVAWVVASSSVVSWASSQQPMAQRSPHIYPVVAKQMGCELNQCTTAQLLKIPGIGVKRAQQIINLRDRRTIFRTGELLKISGIGKKTLRRLRRYLWVEKK